MDEAGDAVSQVAAVLGGDRTAGWGAWQAAFHLGIDWAAGAAGAGALDPGGCSPLGEWPSCCCTGCAGLEKDQGTNLVLAAVREAEPLKLRTAPLIFLSTIVTHLVGGSAGREGAALQLGGSLAAWVGRRSAWMPRTAG